MYSVVKTCVLQGLIGNIVDVESDLSRGIPAFNIVGLPDMAIKESKDRVRAAIKNSGYGFPVNRITINLSPANLKKEGSQIDLAIALAILTSNGEVLESDISDTVFLGELSLDGTLNAINGALPMIISLRELGVKRCIIPSENKDECAFIQDIDIIPISTLTQCVNYLNGEEHIEPCHSDYIESEYKEFDIDFSEIKGQENMKRAMEIAAAGGHNMLMIGPPGSGKTMIAKRLPTILPELSFEESVEVTKIYSVAGLLDKNRLLRNRPFRSPHHTASAVSLIGGGRLPKPGEVSLAHNGVLFLDELPEFSKNVLEVLRQPMEDGEVTISRINASFTYPADFMFIASMNPCPCGYYGDPNHDCTCSINQISSYLGKISSPLLDRIDLHVEAHPVKYDDLSDDKEIETSDVIRKRVSSARNIQMNRYKGTGIYCNSQIKNRDIRKYCKLNSESEKILELAFTKYNFSGRVYNKILKVARTIADLDNSDPIRPSDVMEAIRYRTLETDYWRH